MTVRVSQLLRGCVCQLCQIETIRKFIPTSAVVILANSFIVFRVDYYNSILAGLQTGQLKSRQSVLNSAARLIMWSDTIRSYKRSAARQPTLVACSQRIAHTCKLCLITYK